MHDSWRILATAFLTAAVAFAGGAARAAKLKVLHSFCEGTHALCGDGSNPQGALVSDAGGDFFGTTAEGGHGLGTVFELERKENGVFKFKIIYRFCGRAKNCKHGAIPVGSLIVDKGGNLYGTARVGGSGNGVAFELSPQANTWKWSEKVLYTFCSQQNCTDGSRPNGGLSYVGESSGALFDGVSPLYATTVTGGANNRGTVFQLVNRDGQWTERVLYNFCADGGSNCTDGAGPIAEVTLDASGNIYGMTEQGGGNDPKLDGGAGVIFELSPSGQGLWNVRTLYRFCSLRSCADGARPMAGLVLDSTGTLFGTTLFGGKCDWIPYGCGVIFKLILSGETSKESVLYQFCRIRACWDGAAPNSSLLATDSGDLLGTTSLGGGNYTAEFHKGAGTIFRLSGSTIQSLHRFCSAANCTDGAVPNTKPAIGPDGEIYGTTELGGKSTMTGEGGVLFKVRVTSRRNQAQRNTLIAH